MLQLQQEVENQQWRVHWTNPRGARLVDPTLLFTPSLDSVHNIEGLASAVGS